MARTRFGQRWMLALVVLFALAVSRSASAADKFSFGVMSDTQWKANIDGKNPNTVAVGIIGQLNQEFIRGGVKFVIQVGDLTDNGSAAAMQTRADAAQALYVAGVGFFPLRGNHESSGAAALQFQTLYPQSQGTGDHLAGATGFTSPMQTLAGLSYAFDYGNARFVLLDQFTRTDGTNYLGSSNNNVVDQLPWIGPPAVTRSCSGTRDSSPRTTPIRSLARTLPRTPTPRTRSSPASSEMTCVITSAVTITCTTARSC